MMNEINDLAGQHEVVAENLQASVVRDLALLTKEIKEERKVKPYIHMVPVSPVRPFVHTILYGIPDYTFAKHLWDLTSFANALCWLRSLLF